MHPIAPRSVFILAGILNLFQTSFAADPVLGPSAIPPGLDPSQAPTEQEIEAAEKASARINAYFAKIPQYKPPMEDLELLYDTSLTYGIDEDKRAEFQTIRRNGGTYKAQLEKVKQLRNAINPLHEDWLFAALDYHVGQRNFDAIEASLDDYEKKREEDHLLVLQSKVIAAYLFHLYDSVNLYYEEWKLRETAKDYYARVTKPPAIVNQSWLFNDKDIGIASPPPRPSPFDGLTIEKQRPMLLYFQDRVKRLRELRLPAFRELAKNTSALEISVAKYIEAAKNEKVKVDDTTRIDETNAQIERAVLQMEYLWLMDEFAICSSIYRDMLLSHEKKLRNTTLFDILQERQESHPHLGPNSVLPENHPGLEAAQIEVAKTRASIALVTAMQEEAKLEATSIANASSILYFKQSLQGEFSKWTEGVQSLANWLTQTDRSDIPRLAKQGIQAVFSLVGISYQFASNSYNTLLATPLKDEMIKGARGTGLIEGWKTSTQANLEAYDKAVANYGLRMKLLERLQTQLSKTEAYRVLAEIRHGPSIGLEELLTDYNFSAATQGGIAYVIEPLIDNPQDHKALWLHSAVAAMDGAFTHARNRIAAAQGKEIIDPLAKASAADITLGAQSVIVNKSDVFFKIPTMWRNFVGQYTPAYQGQEQLMKDIESQISAARQLVKDLSQNNIKYSIEILRRKNPSSYSNYKLLATTNLVWNKADYNIQQREWDRAKRFKSTQFKQGTRAEVSQGKLLLAEIQRAEESRFADMAVWQAYLNLTYMVYTGDYRAAAQQAEQLEALENGRRATKGIKQKADYSALKAELSLMAAANQAVVAWEGLLNEAITTIITSKVSTMMHERALGRLNEKWLDTYVKKNRLTRVELGNKIGEQFVATFMPWSKVYGKAKMLDMVIGTTEDLVKTQLAEKIAAAYNYQTGQKNALDAKDIEGVVGKLFDLGNDLRKTVHEMALTDFIQKHADAYVSKESYDNAQAAAIEARDKMKGAFLAGEPEGDESNSERRLIQDLFDDDFQNLSPQEQSDFIKDTVDNETGNIRLDVTKQAFEKYRLAMHDLETEYAAYQKRLNDIHSITLYGMKISKSMDNVRQEMEKMRWNANIRMGYSRTQARGIGKAVAGTRDLFDAYARADLRTRLLQTSHTIEDLEAMVSADNWENLNMPNLLLRRSDDVDAMRRALKVSINEAIAKKGGSDPRKNNVDLDRVMKVAEAIDEIRINKINTLLDQFLTSNKGYGDLVEMVIQGGAAKGNPEYQGIFGDIDFTLMLKAEGVEKTEQIKTDLLAFFEEAGYPLARSKEDESSMDSEAFVQPFDRFDTAQADLTDAVRDIVEKSKDPTRFYSEGGTEWFINNAAYSGMLLWPRGSKRLPWKDVQPSRSHGLAIDMARYLGFLASPKYTEAYFEKHPDKRREYLETALGKGKYFIRLLDAFEIGHPVGNIEYNKRKDKIAQAIESNGRDASYHWQIFEDAKKVIAEDPDGVLRHSDLEHIELIAMIKLKGEFNSPFEAIKEKYKNENLSEAQQLDKAQATVNWMRDKAPEIFAYLGDRWHESAVERGQSPDPAQRADLRAEKQRKMSTLKVIMQNDGGASGAFFAPKEIDGQVLSIADHAKVIRDRLNAAAGVTPLSEPLDAASTQLALNDLSADESRARVLQAAEASRQQIASNRAEPIDLNANFNELLFYLLNAGTKETRQ